MTKTNYEHATHHTRRVILQTGVADEEPNLCVPLTIVAVDRSCSRYWDHRVVPVNLRLGTELEHDVVVRCWLLSTHPYCETTADLLGHQLGGFGFRPRFGICGATLQVWGDTWRTEFAPWPTIDAAKARHGETVVEKLPRGHPDW